MTQASDAFKAAVKIFQTAAMAWGWSKDEGSQSQMDNDLAECDHYRAALIRQHEADIEAAVAAGRTAIAAERDALKAEVGRLRATGRHSEFTRRHL